MAQSLTSANKRTAARAPVTFALLLLGELFSLRLDWFWYLLQVSFVPLAHLFFVRFLWNDEQSAFYAVTGSLVATMSLSAMLSLGQYIGHLKQLNAYEHYAALPISPRTFVLAIATRGVILSLPAMLIVAFVGIILLDLRITLIEVLILLVGAYAMSGIGTLIGFLSPKGQTASLITQITQNIIIFLAPIYVPPDRLPVFLQYSAKLIPTVYIASSLRASLQGLPLTEILPDFGVLIAFAVTSMVLVPMGIKWRNY